MTWLESAYQERHHGLCKSSSSEAHAYPPQPTRIDQAGSGFRWSVDELAGSLSGRQPEKAAASNERPRHEAYPLHGRLQWMNKDEASKTILVI